MKVKYINHMGDDLAVVNAARVSFNRKSELEFASSFDEAMQLGMFQAGLKEEDARLIRYLAKHEHYSPFNHTYISMHVKAPLFVARQLVKHEYMPWNEISRRYVDSKPEVYWPSEWRAGADNVKQGSSDQVINISEGNLDDYIQYDVTCLLESYEGLLRSGVCREQARMILPQNMYTEWYWSGTLKAWAKMYNLRIASDTQKETQEVARQAGEIIAPLFPHSWKALTT